MHIKSIISNPDRTSRQVPRRRGYSFDMFLSKQQAGLTGLQAMDISFERLRTERYAVVNRPAWRRCLREVPHIILIGPGLGLARAKES